MMKSLPYLLALWLLAACSALPLGGERESVYNLQRDALAAYEGDENAKAENLFLALLRTAPNDAVSWFYLGNLYARTDRPDQAVEAYQKSLLLNSADPRPWHNLGVIRLRQARAAFIQAFDLTRPEDVLHGKVEDLIEAMEKLPTDAMRKKPAETGGNGVRK